MTVHEAIAPHVAERIARGQDMLGRLGQRQVYEPNYATEKLADTARCALEVHGADAPHGPVHRRDPLRLAPPPEVHAMRILATTHPGPRVLVRHRDGSYPVIRDDVALAIYWCALSHLRPQSEDAFYQAEALGFLTHRGVWDVTDAGREYLARAIHDAPYA